MADKDFKSALEGKKIPILVLDQKWHRLFALNGKPDNIVPIEEELNALLQRQGKLNQEVKELKKLKTKLMGNIVNNMEGTEVESEGELSEKKLEESKRLIEETNAKIEADEDELLEIPREIQSVNFNLMLESMNYCYDALRDNSEVIKEIAEWIVQVRIDLKKNIIKKQNREIINREMYSYMHDILGPDVMDIFDVENMDIALDVKEKKEDKAEE
ncbi:MAG: hypothetical protein K6F37_02285 [Lachnospiraceae bacterium]|nr:hypothetical protein [Lachnospiraceae bacterium]